MIFALGATEPALVLLVTEKDLQLIRQGRTLFVDQRQLQGGKFDQVVIGYAKTDEDAVALLEKGNNLSLAKQSPIAEPKLTEGRCKGCNGCIALELLFEERCTVCWATEAKKLRGERN